MKGGRLKVWSQSLCLLLYNMLCLFVYFWGKISLCSPGYYGTPCADKDDIEQIESHLPLPSGIEGVLHHTQINRLLFHVRIWYWLKFFLSSYLFYESFMNKVLSSLSMEASNNKTWVLHSRNQTWTWLEKKGNGKGGSLRISFYLKKSIPL